MDPPTLTTMVVLYTTGVRLDTTILVNELPLTDTLIKLEKQGVLKRGESKKDRVRHRHPPAPSKRTTGFGHNSITLVLLSSGNGDFPQKEITVKIFQNGVFHITGVLHDSYDQDVMTRLHELIEDHCPRAILEGTWSLANRRVVLMNYKTKLRGITNLSRDSLHTSMRKQGFKTNYEPDVYPAVKIYFPNTKWIAKVFRTGQIILTGMTTAEECEQLRQTLEPALLRVGQVCGSPAPPTP